jgi:hypothetical protein
MTARHWVLTARDADRGSGQRLPRLDPAQGDALAQQLADLLWVGLSGLPTETDPMCAEVTDPAP